jgi:hypothetical protein
MKHAREEHRRLNVRGLEHFLKKPEAALFEATEIGIGVGKLAKLLDKMAVKATEGEHREV